MLKDNKTTSQRDNKTMRQGVYETTGLEDL